MDTSFCWLIELQGGETLHYYEGPGPDGEALITTDPFLAMKFDREGAAQIIADSIAIWLEGPRVAVEHGFENG